MAIAFLLNFLSRYETVPDPEMEGGGVVIQTPR